MHDAELPSRSSSRPTPTTGSRVWIDLQDPDASCCSTLGATARAPSAGHRGHHRAQPARQDRATRATRSTWSCSRSRTRARSSATRSTSSSASASCSRRTMRTSTRATRHSCARDPTGHLQAGTDYLLWAVADWLVDGYFPVFDQLGDEIDDLQVDVIAQPNQLGRRAAVPGAARPAAHPPRGQPAARDLQPADQSRPGAHQTRADRLLPRRLRPPHPTDRRARQLPRAGQHDARHLPLAGQQQPLRDGQEADRGHGRSWPASARWRASSA